MLVFQDGYCEECGEIYTDINNKWCRPCYINYLRNNFTSSGNQEIDNFVQGMQLKIDKYHDIVFEWIPYGQFNDVKEIYKSGFATAHSATWKGGPLYYNIYIGVEKYVRSLNKKVTLEYSQNTIHDFFNEV